MGFSAQLGLHGSVGFLLGILRLSLHTLDHALRLLAQLLGSLLGSFNQLTAGGVGELPKGFCFGTTKKAFQIHITTYYT